jgi:hypothetical protein
LLGIGRFLNYKWPFQNRKLKGRGQQLWLPCSSSNCRNKIFAEL